MTEGLRGRILHPLVQSPNGLEQLGVGRPQTKSQKLPWISLTGGSSPRTQLIIYSFPRHVSRELIRSKEARVWYASLATQHQTMN